MISYVTSSIPLYFNSMHSGEYIHSHRAKVTNMWTVDNEWIALFLRDHTINNVYVQ